MVPFLLSPTPTASNTSFFLSAPLTRACPRCLVGPAGISHSPPKPRAPLSHSSGRSLPSGPYGFPWPQAVCIYLRFLPIVCLAIGYRNRACPLSSDLQSLPSVSLFQAPVAPQGPLADEQSGERAGLCLPGRRSLELLSQDCLGRGR